MKSINIFSLFKAMLALAPKNDMRYYLNGIRIYRGETNEIIIDATDGTSMIRVQLNGDEDGVICVGENTDIILERTDVERLLKLFKAKNPPMFSASTNGVYFIQVEPPMCLPISVIDGKFPDVNRVLNSRTNKNLTSNPQGVNLKLLSRSTNAMNKLIDNAVFSSHEGNGFKLHHHTDVGDITLLIMPTRV